MKSTEQKVVCKDLCFHYISARQSSKKPPLAAKKKRVQRLFFSFHPPWSSNHKTLLLKNSEKVRQLLVRDFQKVHSAIAIQSSSKKASPSKALSLMLQPKFANFFAVGCKWVPQFATRIRYVGI